MPRLSGIRPSPTCCRVCVRSPVVIAALTSTEPGRWPRACGNGQLVKPSSRDLLRLELSWLVAEVVLLVVITNVNPSERCCWLVLLLVILGYRIERFLVVSKEGTSG